LFPASLTFDLLALVFFGFGLGFALTAGFAFTAFTADGAAFGGIVGWWETTQTAIATMKMTAKMKALLVVKNPPSIYVRQIQDTLPFRR
jgi:hypothetical protein